MNQTHNLDLNLLRVLDVMLEERSVTRTGSRLGLTQSAVSHALNRLRYTLNDELFLRGPAGMQPTPRAVEMGPQVHAALNQLQAALSPADFDPATSERRFSIMSLLGFDRSRVRPIGANTVAPFVAAGLAGGDEPLLPWRGENVIATSIGLRFNIGGVRVPIGIKGP